MNSTINRHIRALIETLGITPYEFSKQIGNKRADNIYNILNEKVEVSATTLNKIFARYPEYRSFVLGGGAGPTVRGEEVASDDSALPHKAVAGPVTFIPLLPISALGGTIRDFVATIRETPCERVISPVQGAELALTVTGDAMAPEFPNGAQILLRRIHEPSFLDWGKTYVLDTCNGPVFKRITPSERKGCVCCQSINPAPEFAPFEVSLNDIHGFYRVLMCLVAK